MHFHQTTIYQPKRYLPLFHPTATPTLNSLLFSFLIFTLIPPSSFPHFSLHIPFTVGPFIVYSEPTEEALLRKFIRYSYTFFTLPRTLLISPFLLLLILLHMPIHIHFSHFFLWHFSHFISPLSLTSLLSSYPSFFPLSLSPSISPLPIPSPPSTPSLLPSLPPSHLPSLAPLPPHAPVSLLSSPPRSLLRFYPS